MRESTARIWRRTALCVLLGLVTTVAVAWLGAAFEKAYKIQSVSEVVVFEKHTSRYYLTRGWFITRNIVNWDFAVTDAGANPSWMNAKTQRNQAAAPYWSQAWREDKPQRPPGTWGDWPHESGLDEVAAGWPFRALYAETDEPVQDPSTKVAVYSFRGGITLPTHVIRDGASIFLPRALPMVPIWPGLAADVAVFSLLWGLAVMPRAIVRARRKAAGCCEACGYSLRGIGAGSPCPECGASPTAA